MIKWSNLRVEDIINDFLKKNLTSKNDTLREMISYMLNGGSARLRSSLLLNLIKDISPNNFDNKLNKALYVAAAIELLHESSLVHDDLPALDNDSIRRGKPSIHVKFGEAKAILFGDWLLNEAFYFLKMSGLNSDILINLLYEFSSCNKELIEGQLLDLQENSDPLIVAQLKTGSLFKLVFVSSSILSGLDEYTKKFLQDLGLKVGILYQIKDDIKDKESDATKRAHSNIILKSTESFTFETIAKLKNEIDNILTSLKNNFNIELVNTIKVLEKIF